MQLVFFTSMNLLQALCANNCKYFLNLIFNNFYKKWT